MRYIDVAKTIRHVGLVVGSEERGAVRPGGVMPVEKGESQGQLCIGLFGAGVTASSHDRL